jgi:hypothetical protein
MQIARGTVYRPEDIALTKTVLDDAAAGLPAVQHADVMKAKLASRILASAAKGRDPIQLKIAGAFGLLGRVSEIRRDVQHDLSGLQVTGRVLFSCAFTLLAALCAYFAIHWMGGEYGSSSLSTSTLALRKGLLPERAETVRLGERSE